MSRRSWALVLDAAAGRRQHGSHSIHNFRGRSIDVIDPVTNGWCRNQGRRAHGIAFSPDAKRVYVSKRGNLDARCVRPKSGKLHQEGGAVDHPNNISGDKNAIASSSPLPAAKGGLDIVDAATLTLSRRSPRTAAGCTRLCHAGQQIRGRRLIRRACSMYSTSTRKQLAWAMRWTLACAAWRSRLILTARQARLLQLSTLNGYSVIDFGQQKEAARVTLPSVPQQFDHGG